MFRIVAMSFRSFVPVAIFLATSFTSALAQTAPNLETGFKEYGTFHGGDIDSISLANGKLQLHIPLLSYPQRGKLHLDFFLKFNNPTYTKSHQCSPVIPTDCWWAISPGSTLFGVRAATDPLDVNSIGALFYNPDHTLKGETLSTYTSDGSDHQMGLVGGTWTQNAVWQAVDGSGLHIDAASNTIFPDGTRVSFPSGYPQAEDANGNEITSTSSAYTDSLGRSIPTFWSNKVTSTTGCTGPLPIDNVYSWAPPSVNGGTAQFKFCFAQVSIQTHFFPPTDTRDKEFSGPIDVLQSVVLPNGQTWTFQYDGYGNLAQITRPTGGVIAYSWGSPVQMCQRSPATQYPPVNFSSSVAQRSVDAMDGNGPHTWNYTGVSGGTKVVDPAGNATVHTLTALGGSCSIYETLTQDYKGDPSSGGTLIKTVQTDYQWSANPNDGFSPPQTVMGVVPIRVTTTWPNNAVTKTETDYDTGFSFTGVYGGGSITYGNPIAKREYDYGTGAPGAPLRETFTQYQAFVNSNYLTYNLIHLPSSVQTCSALQTGETADCAGNTLKQRAYTTY